MAECKNYKHVEYAGYAGYKLAWLSSQCMGLLRVLHGHVFVRWPQCGLKRLARDTCKCSTLHRVQVTCCSMFDCIVY